MEARRRRTTRCLVIAWLCCLLTAGCDEQLVGSGADLVGGSFDVLPPNADCLALGQPADTIHEQMWVLLNETRHAQGTGELLYSRRLELAADRHARDMALADFFAHVNPQGEDPGDRALGSGFCHQWVGENLAVGFDSPGDAQAAWMDSPPHRRNLLSPVWRYVGMGHYRSAHGRHWWVQVFAAEP